MSASPQADSRMEEHHDSPKAAEERLEKVEDKECDLEVSNLSRNVKKGHLLEIFSTYGAVKEAEILVDKRSKLSKGIARITFQREKDAEQAVLYLDGGQIDGKIIKVCFILVSKKRRDEEDEEDATEQVANTKKRAADRDIKRGDSRDKIAANVNTDSNKRARESRLVTTVSERVRGDSRTRPAAAPAAKQQPARERPAPFDPRNRYGPASGGAVNNTSVYGPAPGERGGREGGRDAGRDGRGGVAARGGRSPPRGSGAVGGRDSGRDQTARGRSPIRGAPPARPAASKYTPKERSPPRDTSRGGGRSRSRSRDRNGRGGPAGKSRSPVRGGGGRRSPPPVNRGGRDRSPVRRGAGGGGGDRRGRSLSRSPPRRGGANDRGRPAPAGGARRRSPSRSRSVSSSRSFRGRGRRRGSSSSRSKSSSRSRSTRRSRSSSSSRSRRRSRSSSRTSYSSRSSRSSGSNSSRSRSRSGSYDNSNKRRRRSKSPAPLNATTAAKAGLNKKEGGR